MCAREGRRRDNELKPYEAAVYISAVCPKNVLHITARGALGSASWSARVPGPDLVGLGPRPAVCHSFSRAIEFARDFAGFARTWLVGRGRSESHHALRGLAHRHTNFEHVQSDARFAPDSEYTVIESEMRRAGGRVILDRNIAAFHAHAALFCQFPGSRSTAAVHSEVVHARIHLLQFILRPGRSGRSRWERRVVTT